MKMFDDVIFLNIGYFRRGMPFRCGTKKQTSSDNRRLLSKDVVDNQSLLITDIC